MNFLERAKFTASKNVRVIRLSPRSKAAMDSGWPELATTDLGVLTRWNTETPEANCAAVADGTPSGVWFFEADSREVFDRIKADTGHDLIVEVPTYLVRSREGRGHVYLRNTPAALEMGNISQGYVKHGDFSVRVRNAYVVSAFSIHPHSDTPYTPINNNEILPAPDWFIQWLLDQRTKTVPTTLSGVAIRPEGEKIQHGYIHSYLVTTAGKLRSQGLEGDLLEAALLDLAHKNCEEPLNDAQIKQVARSFDKYEANPAASIALELNQRPDDGATTSQIADDTELPVFEDAEYPKFPEYVWSNTSLYKNFVEPVCRHNSRIPYFMWLPSLAILSNYIGTKVQVKSKFAQKAINMSQYLVLIGKRGLTNKSSCVDDAISYFNYIGCLTHDGGLKTADGKTVVWTPGSAEGLGIDMQRTNCKNGLIFYDELSQLIKKAGVDGSTLSSQLLTLYEAKKFGNSVKHAKEKFSLDPGTYVVSLMTCCTTETFQDLWSRLNGNDTGLNDRTMFVLEPEELPERRIKEEVNIFETATVTRQLIDRAIQQGVFEVENWNNAKLQALVPLGDRYVSRAVKWALALAVDLGLSVVDDECVDRGCDIVRYEIKVKEYLKTYDAKNREAALQLRIRQILEMRKGEMLERDLRRVAHADREGTSAWSQAFYGLQKAGIIRLMGTGGRTDPRRVQVLIRMESDDSSS